MFKFAFGDTKAANTSPETQRAGAGQSEKPPPRIVEIEDVDVSSCEIDLLQVAPDLTLKKSTADVPSTLSANGADVVAGVYEGGFKLWECAVDLVRYIHKNGLKGASVLEIGAGHGLPGIVMGSMGARLALHDFNEEVLQLCTAVNVKLNEVSNVRFVAGDWGRLQDVLGEEFDVVLSAETVYSEKSLRSLAHTILDSLKPGGYALIAGKTYYFGVGGGMASFRNLVKDIAKERGINVNIEVVEQMRDGKSNVREIARIHKLLK